MDNDTTHEKLLHDLRNQLNNISMNAELAKLELATEQYQSATSHNSETTLGCINVILKACVKCAAIADNLAATPAPGSAADLQ